MVHGNPANFGRSSYNIAKPCMCQQGALNNGCESLDNARVLDPAAATAPAARVGRLRPVMPRGSLRGTGWPLLSSHIGNGLGSSSTRRLHAPPASSRQATPTMSPRRVQASGGRLVGL